MILVQIRYEPTALSDRSRLEIKNSNLPNILRGENATRQLYQDP